MSAAGQPADFLLELGTEELPPKSLQPLRDALAAQLTSGLDEAQLSHGEVLSFATPRRLAVLVKALATEQSRQTLELRGPPVSIAFDDAGEPTQAARAFAAKCGVGVADLTRTASKKGEWLFFAGSRPGQPAAELLPELVSRALAALPIPKRMRWGAGDAEFVRPVHWLVMLLGETVVPATVLGVEAGRTTRGHRFHHPAPIELRSATDYTTALEQPGHVIADFAARRDRVVAAAHAAAAELDGEALLDTAVVDEVTALVEWPVPVTGRFSKEFLQLPPEVLISTLQDHQRYFPVTRDTALLPAFITISNLASSDPAEVRRGNERVVTPRLADAAFFWQQDIARPLAERVPQLDAVVYQQGLGSLADKSARIGALAKELANPLGADPAATARAAELARTDLLTAMVGEFPELQGRMGYYYALEAGEAQNVAVALEEQYLPRHAGDRLPAAPEGVALALADRLDTLAGVFALGKKPTGNKDPFGLRRQALGMVRIMVERGVDVQLPPLLERAADLQPALEGPAPELGALLYDFVADRMRAWYLDGLAPGLERGAITAELFQAVAVRRPASLLDFHARLMALQQFMHDDASASLAAANKRIANMLRKSDTTPAATVNPELFESDAERGLQSRLERVRETLAPLLAERDYRQALTELATLKAPVDAYFDAVMVMCEDAQVRGNRLTQLSQLRALFLDVADLSCISVSQAP